MFTIGVVLGPGFTPTWSEAVHRTNPQDLIQKFVTLLEHSSDFIYFKDKDSRMLFCSQNLAELCGYEDWRELIGKRDSELFPEETARIYYEEELPIFRDGKPLLNRVAPYIDRQGNRRWVSTCKWPVLGPDGKTVVSLCGVSRDITAEQQASEDLRRQALRNEALLEAGSDGIHVMDTHGNLRQANDTFCQMLGYTHEEVLKLNVAQWDARWSDRELKDDIIPAVMEHRQVFETRHRRRDGRVIDVEVSATGVEIGGERLLFASSRDITERKRAEEEQRRFSAELAEANRLKDIFTDVLRHDILNPAGAIKNATDILLRSESDPRKIGVLQMLQHAATSLIEMTQNAARLASLSARDLEFVPADVVQVVRSVLPELDHKVKEKNLTLADHSNGAVSASVHPILKEAVANLVSNAIKYSPSGARIDMGVEDSGESWLLFVKDQGCGVADEHKERIFNRFERLGKDGVRGSGLGLTITRQIVGMHGGTVWVDDNPAGGSIFSMRLPKTPPQSHARTNA